MSEVIVPERTSVSPAPIVAWTPLGENAILVRSACDAIPAKVPVAVDGNPRNRAQTMVLSWRRPGAEPLAATGFLCLAPAPSVDNSGTGALLIGRPGRPLRLILAAKPQPLQTFLSELAEDAGQAFPSVVDGLLEVLLTGAPNPRRLRAVAMLLQTVARPGGFVEVMGALEGDGIFLQGWTSDFAAGRLKLLIAHGGLSPAHLEAGTFERGDLGRARAASSACSRIARSSSRARSSGSISAVAMAGGRSRSMSATSCSSRSRFPAICATGWRAARRPRPPPTGSGVPRSASTAATPSVCWRSRCVPASTP
ncbi:hypothetical protein [Bosea sp. TAB14]|uniref:hypothetical protein n=1 Tax=Bosea sp. TAB14 TaxID=3237481 RepID=UPI003F8FAB0A